MKSIKDRIEEDMTKFGDILSVAKPIVIVEEITYSIEKNGAPAFSTRQFFASRLSVANDNGKYLVPTPNFARRLTEAIANNQFHGLIVAIHADPDSYDTDEHIFAQLAEERVVKNTELILHSKNEQLSCEFALSDALSIASEALTDITDHLIQNCHSNYPITKIHESYNLITVEFENVTRNYLNCDGDLIFLY